jgi:hypothetical protein
VPSVSSRCCRAYCQFFTAVILLAASHRRGFDNLDDCQSRLRGFALAEGFDVVKHGSGIKKAPASRYKYIFYSVDSRNYRKLKDHMVKDSEGKINSRRKRDATSVWQLQCIWSAICSFKFIGKRGLGEREFVLTVQYNIYEDHEFAENSFIFSSHLKLSEEF